MKKISLLMTLFCWGITLSKAQTQVDFGFNGQIGFPIQEFAEKTNVVGLGGGFYTLIAPFKQKQLRLGFTMDYQIYGNKARYDWGSGWKVSVNNNLLMLHSLVRFNLRPTSKVQPYFDGLLGAKHFYTRTKFKEIGNRDNVFGKTNFGDWALSYGGAAGLQFFMSEYVYFDLRATYLNGNEATYVDKKSILNNPNNLNDVLFTTKTSRTDMVLVHFGIVAKLTHDAKQ